MKTDIKNIQLNERETLISEYETTAKEFINDLPYLQEPYKARNWGHPWHSMCSYHGKLKPGIAHFLVEMFTKKGDRILDPLSGVGTIPFEAFLSERVGYGNDLSKLAYVVTKAKIEYSDRNVIDKIILDLESYIEKNKKKYDESNTPYKDFGFNGKIPTYFHPDTYSEILSAREYFMLKGNSINTEEAVVLASLLHVLHGNRPYALSRCSHPLTPYAPRGEFEYKNVISHIKNKINLTYQSGMGKSINEGKAFYGDYINLQSSGLSGIDAIITSPPFAGSIKFYIQNWMRLWLVGWEPQSFKDAEKMFLEAKQKISFDAYSDFFETCYNVLKPNGKVILHLGKTNKIDMAEELSKIAAPWFKEVYRGAEIVKDIEKHGIKDKGATTHHQYLFLIKN